MSDVIKNILTDVSARSDVSVERALMSQATTKTWFSVVEK